LGKKEGISGRDPLPAKAGERRYPNEREEILKRRKDEKQATLGRRFRYNLGQAPNQTRGELRTEL
jgi:hypothetical protein